MQLAKLLDKYFFTRLEFSSSLKKEDVLEAVANALTVLTGEPYNMVMCSPADSALNRFFMALGRDISRRNQ